jgi:hypothetical protein
MGEGEAGNCQTRERLLCSCRAAVDRCAAPPAALPSVAVPPPSFRAAVGRSAPPSCRA